MIGTIRTNPIYEIQLSLTQNEADVVWALLHERTLSGITLEPELQALYNWLEDHA